MNVILPIRTVNPLNERCHWAKRAKRSKSERSMAKLLTPKTALPCRVILTRIAPRAMDGDGLQASFKAIRDGVADKLGVLDNDKRVTWQYRQIKGQPKEYAVHICIL